MAEEKETEEILMGFLSKCLEDLSYVVEKSSELLEEELRGYAGEAWGEVKGRIEQALGQLKSLDEDPKLMSGLKAQGLTGSQLRFKNAGFQRAHREFQDSFLIKPLGPILRKLLAWLNIILGSLSKVLPVLEPVKEYKEALEHSLI